MNFVRSIRLCHNPSKKNSHIFTRVLFLFSHKIFFCDELKFIIGNWVGERVHY